MRKLWLLGVMALCCGATFRVPSDTRVFAPITLSCSTTPALSGTYLIDDAMMVTLNTIVGFYVANGNSFPAAASSIAVLDTSLAVHTFPSLAAFQNFYKAVAVYWVLLSDYQNRVAAGQSPSLPASTSSAC